MLHTDQMESNVKSTYKSSDTEEWLDTVWTRPIGYLWALFFKRLSVHPNTVTALSMILGAGSAFFFAHGSYRTEGKEGLMYNIIAILLLAWANFYDSADGQLARMTGQKTILGRILDGASSDVWFVPIYSALVVRFYFHHDIEFQWLGIENNTPNALIAAALLCIGAVISGLRCHGYQCGLADYYRQIHLFFLKGETGSELDTSAQQKEIYDDTPWRGNVLWKIFLKSYVSYTRSQEARTPQFQRLRAALKNKYGSSDRIPQEFRNRFRAGSLPLMPLTNILTFNTRATVLYLTCLIDFPWLYFIFEMTVMVAIYHYMRHRHERLCRKLCDQL